MSLSEKTKQTLLTNLYYSPNTQYTSIKTLHDAVRNKGISYNEVRAFVQQQASSQLFKRQKQIKHYFPITAKFKFEILQMDLVDISDIATTNDNFKYLLVAVDVFSRYAFVIPLKNKNAETVTEAVKYIVEKTEPQIINSDLGSEFINSSFRTLIAKHGTDINYVPVNEHKKLAIVDRFVRTLREKINMYLAQQNTTRYIDVLKQLVHNYNHAYHRGIKKIPADVKNVDSHILKVDNEKYNKAFMGETLFNVGDKVRYITNKTSFRKGTLPKWSKSVHTIVSTDFHRYILENGLSKKYYELQKVEGVQQLDKPENLTREQLRKERGVQRKFVRSGLNREDILDFPRERKPNHRYSDR